MQIARKGLIKLFEFSENLLDFKNLDKKSKKILQIILKPCARALEEGIISVKF